METNTMKRWLAACMASFCLSMLPTEAQENEPFWLGADMGWLTEMESKGQKLYDLQGQEREGMSLMADYGINAQRIRVWVNPVKHGNWCNKQDVLAKCQRAQSLGQAIMVNFHYSDWWADPGKQNIPEAWRGMTFEQMKQALADHTVEVLTYLKEHQIKVKWVQVGNETSNGMLWSIKMDPKTGWEWKDANGKTQMTESMGHLEKNPKEYAGFVRAGYEAVKQVYPEAICIVHLDNGFDNDLYNRNLDTLLQHGAKFDMIGMSLYPYWSMEAGREPSAEKTITDCIRNINLVTKKYGVPVMITETGYLVDERNPKVMEEGRDQLRRLIYECKAHTGGLCKGVFYWEPECRPSQYKLGAFTEDGRPTAIMDGFLSENLNGQLWFDTDGHHINAHGGNIIQYGDTYYWYGENRPYQGFTTEAGVGVYSSKDLRTWKNEGIALTVSEERGHDIERGCIMERPKVLYNEKTHKFVMLFHLELKGRGYEAARVAFAESDTPTGPFRYLRSTRINAGVWPFNMDKKAQKAAQKTDAKAWKDWWSDEWRAEVEKGMYLWRDFQGGQMSRDMTVFIDDDGTAYHITSSQENLTLLISELTPDYLDYTGKYTMVAPGGQNEAPCIVKLGDTYWLICSGCTGWAPNEARMFSAKSIWGPWTQHPSPFVGEATGYRNMPANKTFGAQGTYIYNMYGKPIFMADIWNERHLSQSLHLWLPIEQRSDGTPVIRWVDKW